MYSGIVYHPYWNLTKITCGCILKELINFSGQPANKYQARPDTQNDFIFSNENINTYT